ncbi:MAG TPA: class I SAM-dependent methyltransferase [Terriglobia bacterium]|nr:class I SAM-dependent methyltransferase [Terriglobia bacterium]
MLKRSAPCPVCGDSGTSPALVGRDRLLRSTTRVFELSACPACECLFIDPQPLAGELAAFYPDTYWRKTEPSRLGAAEALYRRIALADHLRFLRQTARHVQGAGPHPRLLDVGCGTGLLLDQARRAGFSVTGIDASAQAAATAETEYGIPVRTGTLDQTKFETGAFDIVTMFHTLEHVTAPRAAIAEAHRVLQPRGRLILQVPNIGSWQRRLLGANWHGLDIPRHTINYSRRSLVRLLSACGFHVRRIRHFNLRDNAPALASSLAPHLDPISRAARNQPEGPLAGWARHLVYLGLVAMACPFALVEATAGCGATLMVEAAKS